MESYDIDLPALPDTLAELNPGDIVYLNGRIYTGRIGFYRKLLEKRDPFPDTHLFQRAHAAFHCSPAGSILNGKPYIAAVTGTASFRFKDYLESFFQVCGTKIIIGKGGMGEDVYENIFRKYGAVYLSTMGYGLGAIYGKAIHKVVGLFWEKELGLAQAVWEMEVSHFGPLLVDSDLKGRSFLTQEADELSESLVSAIKAYKDPQLKRFGEISDYSEEVIS